MLFGPTLRRLLTLPPLAVAVVTLAGVAATVPDSATGATPAGAPLSRVVVLSPTSVADASAAVARAGGRVLDTLPLVNGLVAGLPRQAALPAAYGVVADRPLHVAAAPGTADGTVSTARAALGMPAQGREGAGVGVAVVDTGVAAVPALAGQVVRHIDVSGHRPGDGYGHGTFLAGLIASTDRTARGVAPGAHLLDVRVAQPDGSTDLVDVLRGLQAVAAEGPRYGVRVVNLALTSDSPLPYQLDPLTIALDALWAQGYVVVVPAGNSGPAAGSVGSPGLDPTLLTAGGLDAHGTPARTDDSVADWSSRGPTWEGDAKPDLAAPGTHLLSLRVPGSVIDRQNPQARVGTTYFRGSGTSMATAVTAGAVADVIARNPRLRPDDVKQLLEKTAYPVGADATAAGAGGLDLAGALSAAPGATPSDGCLPVNRQANRGHGSTAHQQSPQCGQALLAPGDAAAWRDFVKATSRGDVRAASRAWSRLDAASRAWSARTWAGLSPQARDWAAQEWGERARAWSDRSTSAEEWLARFWTSRAWSSRAWSSRAWSSRAWSSRAWSSRAWSGDVWGSRAWSSRAWSSRAWSSRAWSTVSWG